MTFCTTIPCAVLTIAIWTADEIPLTHCVPKQPTANSCPGVMLVYVINSTFQTNLNMSQLVPGIYGVLILMKEIAFYIPDLLATNNLKQPDSYQLNSDHTSIKILFMTDIKTKPFHPEIIFIKNSLPF